MTLAGSPLIRQLEEQLLTPEQGFSTSAVLTFGARWFLGGVGGRSCPLHCRRPSSPDLYSTRCQYNPGHNHHDCLQKGLGGRTSRWETAALRTLRQSRALGSRQLLNSAPPVSVGIEDHPLLFTDSTGSRLLPTLVPRSQNNLELYF